MLRVTPELWRERMNNLIERREKKTDNYHIASNIADYGSHLSKIEIGKCVLDIGCGSMYAKQFMPEGTTYLGIDAFPISNEVVAMRIEECYFEDKSFDTLIVFAVLDGLQDFNLAMHHMKRICKKNILILTGIGIEPDQYHTMMITEKMLDEAFSEWNVTHKEYLAPKVLLIEYTR